MERENLAGDAKRKGTSGSNREAESTDAPERGGLPRSSEDRGHRLRVRAQRGTLPNKKGPGDFTAAFSAHRKMLEPRQRFKLPSEPVVQADGEQVEPTRHGDGIGHKEAGVVHVV
jgi:hypothetical protein